MSDSSIIVPSQVEVLPEGTVGRIDTLTTTYPWQVMDGEPDLWFQRFTKYFLPLGPGRTLIKAYTIMVDVEHPEVAKARKEMAKKDPGKTFNVNNITSLWGTKAREWNWRDRAKAFDRFSYQLAQAEVDLARVTLLGSANKAALALVEALSNPRLQVAAAKEILDRAGLPGTTNVALGPIDKFTSDELAQATQDLEGWESQLHPKLTSDSNG